LPGEQLKPTSASPRFYDVVRDLRAKVRDVGPINESKLLDETSARGLALIRLLEQSPETKELLAGLIYPSSQSQLAATIPAARRRLAERLVRNGLALAASLRLADRMINEKIATYQRADAARVAGMTRAWRRSHEPRPQFWDGRKEAPPTPPKPEIAFTAYANLETYVRPTRAELAADLEAALQGGEISFQETIDVAVLDALESADEEELTADMVEKWSAIVLAAVAGRSKVALSAVKDSIFRAGLVGSWGNKENALLRKIIAAHGGFSVRMGRPFLADGSKGLPTWCVCKVAAPAPEAHAS
jgi:hypothetical protein